MSIRSMTGFARSDGNWETYLWHWELRSVNGRGLDVRLRLPSGFETLEPAVRELLSTYVSRGNVSANLSIKQSRSTSQIAVNEDALAKVLELADGLRKRLGAAPPTVDGLLALKGVLETQDKEEDETERAKLGEALLVSCKEAAERLVAARAGEGARLGQLVQEYIGEIERVVSQIANSPARSVEAIRKRIADQVARITDSASDFDPQRLHQEAVLIATKSDIEEELKRLTAHIAAARDLLESGKAIGRNLDFLAQEFNREANTICSKAIDGEITRSGLTLKAVIDQLREQVQNIE